MVKTFICFLVFAFLCKYSISQNLVSNPSFEEFVDFQKYNESGWHKVQESDTPDYFNFSEDNPSNNIYNKYMGNIYPRSGDGFIGIFCYRNSSVRGIKNIREFIETKLTEELEKDSLYKVEISLRLDIESTLALKNFDILFSKESFYVKKNFKPFTLKPQVEFNSQWLDSTSNWLTVQALYKAQGGEEYIILGNFNTDTKSGKKNVSYSKGKKKRYKWDLVSNEDASYYYVDDVSVIKVPVVKRKLVELIQDTIVQTQDSVFNIDQLEIDSAIVLKNINFEFNNSDLLPESYKELNKLKKLLIDNPAIRIMLEGHTDNIGGYDFNLNLSVKRVEAVVAWLINEGIDAGRLEYVGYSYSKPLKSNDSEEGRSINRRVAFKIISK